MKILDAWNQYVADPSDDTRNAVVEAYLPYFRYAASKVKQGGTIPCGHDDMMQEAALALLLAIPLVDTALDPVHAIGQLSRRAHGAMVDALRKTTPGSRSGCKYADIKDDLAKRLARIPTLEEIITETGMRLSTVLRKEVLASLPEQLHSDPGQEQSWRHPALRTDVGTTKDKDAVDARTNVLDIVKLLPTSQRIVIERYYLDGWTMHRIADELGISESAVSIRHSEAMKRLRRMLTARGLAPEPRLEPLRVQT